MQGRTTNRSTENDKLASRSTREVIEDHIRLQVAGQIDEDLQRNYAPDVVRLDGDGDQPGGHEAIRRMSSHLYRHGPGSGYEIVALRVQGDFALLFWKASGPDYVVNCAADSFVVAAGKIRLQTSVEGPLASAAGYLAGAPTFRPTDAAREAGFA